MKIKIYPYLYKKMLMYARAVNTEISGLGSVVIDKYDLLIDNIYLIEQVSTGVDTTLSPEGLTKFLLRDDIKPETIKLWWHSHANMNVFWSATDNECISELGKSLDWLISIVVNKHGQYRMRLDVFRPERITLDKLTLYINLDLKINKKEIEEEVKRKVNSTYVGNMTQFVTQQCITTPSRILVLNHLYELQPQLDNVCPMCNIVVNKDQIYCHNCGGILK